jgi:hypothetical protein
MTLMTSTGARSKLVVRDLISPRTKPPLDRRDLFLRLFGRTRHAAPNERAPRMVRRVTSCYSHRRTIIGSARLARTDGT